MTGADRPDSDVGEQLACSPAGAETSSAPTPSRGAFLPASSHSTDAVALIDGERAWTWRDLELDAARLAHALAADGLSTGDRVAVLGRNSAEWLLAYLGSTLAGTVFLPVNHHLRHDELVYLLRDSATRLVLCDAEHEARARDAAREAGVERVRIIDHGFGGWLEGRPESWPATHVGGSAMMYTSGTTGRPKGLEPAPQTRSAAQVIEDMAALARVYGYPRGGAHLVASTMDHGAPALNAFMAIAMGQTIVIERRFDAVEALELIARHRVTTTHLVPTQIIRLLRVPDSVKRGIDVSSLQAIFHGAAPLPPWAKRAAIEWLGPILIEYFGAKEGCGPFICTSAEWLARPGTVGRAGAHVAVSVVGDDGRDLPAGEVGTLYFRRADGRAPVYRGDPGKTAASRLPDGRFTVGDVGWLDEDGWLYLADRRDDLILTGGVNVYPAEVEATLGQHPAVEDCAVYGIPDEEWGESVKAAVVRRAGATIDEAELVAWLRERLAHYKCPRSIDFVSELPREEIGKLKRRVLRDAARAGGAANVR